MKSSLTLLPHRISLLFALILTLVFSVCMADLARADITVFSHTFDGGASDLNNTAVDGGAVPGSWVAASVVTADGAFSTGIGSATLAFAPSHGFIYVLDARLLNITGDSNWVAFGFANNQSTEAGAHTHFRTSTVVGTAWMFVRGFNTEATTNATFLGSGETSPIVDEGLLNAVAWPSLNNYVGGSRSLDLRIVLDTTGGSGNWTAAWLAKLTTDGSYAQLRVATPVPIADQARYTSVGFGFSNGGSSEGDETMILQGKLQSFSLTSFAIPEPSTALLGGLGLLGLLRRRRR